MCDFDHLEADRALHREQDVVQVRATAGRRVDVLQGDADLALHGVLVVEQVEHEFDRSLLGTVAAINMSPDALKASFRKVSEAYQQDSGEYLRESGVLAATRTGLVHMHFVVQDTDNVDPVHLFNMGRRWGLWIDVTNIPNRTKDAREYVANLSRGGAFIRTNDPPSPGRRVLVQIHVPDAEPIETIGRIAWSRKVLTPNGESQDGGAGVEFLAGKPLLEQISRALDLPDEG